MCLYIKRIWRNVSIPAFIHAWLAKGKKCLQLTKKSMDFATHISLSFNIPRSIEIKKMVMKTKWLNEVNWEFSRDLGEVRARARHMWVPRAFRKERGVATRLRKEQLLAREGVLADIQLRNKVKLGRKRYSKHGWWANAVIGRKRIRVSGRSIALWHHNYVTERLAAPY